MTMSSEERSIQKPRASKLKDMASVAKFSTVAKVSGKAAHDTAKKLTTTKLFKKKARKPPSEELYEGFGTDIAEAMLLEGLEERGRLTIPNGDGFRPAIEGERPPLGIEDLGNAFGDDEEEPQVPSPRTSFRNMVQRSYEQDDDPDLHDRDIQLPPPISMSNHRRAQSLLESINESDHKEEENNSSDEPFAGPAEIMVDESHHLLGDQIMEGYSSVPYQRLQEARRNEPRRRFQNIRACLKPSSIKGVLRIIFTPYLVWVFPLFLISMVLFYIFGNPGIDFLPGEATVSWWLNFIGRHIILLQLSIILQTILFDWIIMSTRLILEVAGPWTTLFCLQSRGWPFLVGTWGILALCMLHGDNDFVQHWFAFTGMRIFTVANSGSYILTSTIYLRVLLGMLFAGIATSLKRTVVTLYFGKRSFDIYKAKLERILNNVIVISEVAELAEAADEIQVAETSNRRAGHVRWSSLRFEESPSKTMKRSTSQTVLNNKAESGEESTNHSESESEEDSESEESKDESKDEEARKVQKENIFERRPSVMKKAQRMKKSISHLSLDNSSVKNYKMKNQLGRWNDPMTNMGKQSQSCTVSDILKFRKALTYMDLQHPFSESFGPASTRDELLTSAQALYTQLLRFTDGGSTLPQSVLAVLAENGDGTVDKQKRKNLKKIFPPDGNGNISILTFLMGCDAVYKKLRYFRASVGNTSVIDKVLEDIIDAVFFFILTIIILTVLNLNPWPLLVSISTLGVTFAFAVGDSCARAVEGVILIVGRRPYEIGDRIVISDTPGGDVSEIEASWIVEDITLFSTTLRYSANNEVAIVSNGSIAQSRITNCAKSKNAMVQIEMQLDMKLHEGTYLREFREALDAYVLNNPNRWDSIVFFRCEAIDTDYEVVTYRLMVRSTQTWQPAFRVLEYKAQLNRFLCELSLKMGVNYESPLDTRVLYTGGALHDTSDPQVNRARAREKEALAAQQPDAAQEPPEAIAVVDDNPYLSDNVAYDA